MLKFKIKNGGLVKNSNLPLQRKHELLVELKKNVPQVMF